MFRVQYILVEALALFLSGNSYIHLQFIKMILKDIDFQENAVAHFIRVPK